MIKAATISSRRGRAFTIVELLVAMTILTVLLTATSVIWSSQQKIIQIAAAQEEISPYGRALESNLRHDLQGLSRDGFMVISSNSYTYPGAVGSDPAGTYNIDQLAFFSNGLKTAVRSTAAVTLTSRIWYGHLMTSDWGVASFPNLATPPWKLSLGRQDLVLQPGSNGPISIIDPLIINGNIDYANTDMLTIKQAVFSGAPAQNMASACYRIKGQRYVDPSNSNAFSGPRGLMDIHALMAPFCSSFRVQFAGRYNVATPVGQMDTIGGQVVWYGTDDSGAMQNPLLVPIGNTQYIFATNSFVFSPDQPSTWPMAIQVTVDLHDSNGRLHERFRKLRTYTTTANAVDGYRYRFIIKL